VGASCLVPCLSTVASSVATVATVGHGWAAAHRSRGSTRADATASLMSPCSNQRKHGEPLADIGGQRAGCLLKSGPNSGEAAEDAAARTIFEAAS
jgi:hypothetical protein